MAKPGPWSQGPVLAQTLQLLRGADLTYVDGVPTEATAHLATEAAKLAFAGPGGVVWRQRAGSARRRWSPALTPTSAVP